MRSFCTPRSELRKTCDHGAVDHRDDPRAGELLERILGEPGFGVRT